MYDFINIAKALSDENRVRALMMLCRGELCVCQLIEMLRLAPSTVSKHMSILRQARLVESRKDGRWMYYRLTNGDASEDVLQAIRWLQNSLAKDKQILADARQVKHVCKIDKDELCDCYKKPKLKNNNKSTTLCGK
ncbi:MAG TPA: metalloregulator ArsR/SmtB family transcription factor [Sedimentisphaerales bacterium]|nr:metalloregulator ArsR/SmtB family transcription factor [Sedimentisphaerales bacterium]